MDLGDIKDKIDVINNTKDIENIESILAYGDLGTKIKEVLEAVKNLTLPDVMPSFSFNNYTKQNGECEDCVLHDYCKPHCATVTFEEVEYRCRAGFEKNWA